MRLQLTELLRFSTRIANSFSSVFGSEQKTDARKPENNGGEKSAEAPLSKVKTLARQGNFEAAIEHAHKIVSHDPNAVFAVKLVAQDLIRNHRLSDARARLEGLQHKSARDLEVLRLRALLESLDQNFEQEARIWAEMFELYPGHVHAALREIQAWTAAGKAKTANDRAQTLLRSDLTQVQRVKLHRLFRDDDGPFTLSTEELRKAHLENPEDRSIFGAYNRRLAYRGDIAERAEAQRRHFAHVRDGTRRPMADLLREISVPPPKMNVELELVARRLWHARKGRTISQQDWVNRAYWRLRAGRILSDGLAYDGSDPKLVELEMDSVNRASDFSLADAMQKRKTGCILATSHFDHLHAIIHTLERRYENCFLVANNVKLRHSRYGLDGLKAHSYLTDTSKTIRLMANHLKKGGLILLAPDLVSNEATPKRRYSSETMAGHFCVSEVALYLAWSTQANALWVETSWQQDRLGYHFRPIEAGRASRSQFYDEWVEQYLSLLKNRLLTVPEANRASLPWQQIVG